MFFNEDTQEKSSNSRGLIFYTLSQNHALRRMLFQIFASFSSISKNGDIFDKENYREVLRIFFKSLKIFSSVKKKYFFYTLEKIFKHQKKYIHTCIYRIISWPNNEPNFIKPWQHSGRVLACNSSMKLSSQYNDILLTK